MVHTLQRHTGPYENRHELRDPDTAAVAAAVADARAFAALYLRYIDPIYRYCHRRLGSREEAEDAASLVFTKALSALSTYRPDNGSFRSWLFVIAHNAITDEHRRFRLEPSTTDLELVDGAPSPEAVVIEDEAGWRVRALLAQLTPDQAEVVELRLAGLRGPEIAQVTGRSPNTVKVTQHRAYTRLRALLAGKEAPDVH